MLSVLLLPSFSFLLLPALWGGAGPGLVDDYGGGPGWAPEGLRRDCGGTAAGLRPFPFRACEWLLPSSVRARRGAGGGGLREMWRRRDVETWRRDGILNIHHTI